MLTKKELLKKLKEENITISDKMLTYFASLGLIKKPIRTGLGQGKGSMSEFDDRVVNDIKQIVTLHEDGLTYEQIKQKKMSRNEWLSFVKQIRESSKSEEDATDSIKKLPYLANWEKGRLKLIGDMAESLTKVFVSELSVMLHSFTSMSEEDLFDEAYEVIESYLSDLVCYGGVGSEEDFEAYLEGKTSRYYYSSMGRVDHYVDSLVEKLKREQKARKPAKGGKKHGGKD